MELQLLLWLVDAGHIQWIVGWAWLTLAAWTVVYVVRDWRSTPR